MSSDEERDLFNMSIMALKDLLSIMFMIEHGGVKEIKI
jgi:hypothetical protein